MNKLEVLEPTEISVEVASRVLHEGFVRLWKNKQQREKIEAGISAFICIDMFTVSVVARVDGAVIANLFTQAALKPCACAEINQTLIRHL